MRATWSWWKEENNLVAGHRQTVQFSSGSDGQTNKSEFENHGHKNSRLLISPFCKLQKLPLSSMVSKLSIPLAMMILSILESVTISMSPTRNMHHQLSLSILFIPSSLLDMADSDISNSIYRPIFCLNCTVTDNVRWKNG